MSPSPERCPTDRVFEAGWRPTDFVFDRRVAEVFDDMVGRSVPFYAEIQRMQTELAVSLLAGDSARVYDLGCSTATTIDAIARHPNCPPQTEFVGIDSSHDMLEQAKAKLDAHGLMDRVVLQQATVDRQTTLKKCDIVLMNWTLQFVRPIDRSRLLQHIAEAIRPGGALLLSEKILVGDSLLNRLYIEFYYDYKRAQGYSDSEIQNKREALENVLVPYRSDENRALLYDTGFASVDAYFRWFNFECLIARKPG